MKKAITITVILLTLILFILGCTQDTSTNSQITIDDLEYTNHLDIPEEFEIPIEDLNQYFELAQNTWYPSPDDKCKLTNEIPQLIIIIEQEPETNTLEGQGYYTWAYICTNEYFIVHFSSSYGPHTYGPFDLEN